MMRVIQLMLDAGGMKWCMWQGRAHQRASGDPLTRNRSVSRNKARNTRRSITMRRFAVAMGLVFQIGGLIICAVLGSFSLGLWLDRRFGSAPCLMVALVIVGFAIAVVGAYRIATRLSE